MSKSFSFKHLLENAIFIWLGIVLIFILGGDALVLPNWLQVIGRSHPLLLHFPIVLLLVGLFFFWLPRLRNKPELRSLGEYFLLIGINFAGMTVIAGMILAQEDYEGNSLIWHQWSGIGIFLLAIALYFFRDKSKNLIKAATLAIAVGVVVTGHLGANLTHGDDFLLAPIQPTEVELIPLAEAEIFRDMVQPILKAKCESCHKEGKIKGELRLDTQEGIMKGGKSGLFAVGGELEKSMLIERIHLPLEDKKHMPPKNKVQLTDEEIVILQEWISSGASFGDKVIQTDPESELFKLASNKFETEKTYNFAAADLDEVNKLSNFYRSVQPLFPESPALEVTYYGIAAFDPNSLSELKTINTQLVKLSLNKMPLAGVDLTFLAEFPNLEELQVNFADLNSSQIEAISTIPNLKILAISGNPLDEKAIQHLTKMTNLEKLFMWQNGISEAQENEIRNSLTSTEIDFGFDASGKIYTLNSPLIEVDQLIYKDSLKVTLKHPIKSVELRYTLDGSEPDSLQSKLYQAPFWLNTSADIKVRAFAKEWIGSLVENQIVFKSSIEPIGKKLATEPNPQYKGTGVSVLFDKSKATLDHARPGWLGFQDNPMELEMSFGKVPSSIGISLLLNEEAHIFPPELIEVWISKDNKWSKIITERPVQSTKSDLKRFDVVTLNLPNEPIEKIRVKVSPLSKLPNWHSNKGSKGWVFVDEIFVN